MKLDSNADVAIRIRAMLVTNAKQSNLDTRTVVLKESLTQLHHALLRSSMFR